MTFGVITATIVFNMQRVEDQIQVVRTAYVPLALQGKELARIQSDLKAYVDEGFTDVLIAYPTAQASGAALVADANRRGARVAIVVDAPEHLALLAAAGEAAGVRVPVVVDVDVSYRHLRDRVTVSIRRRPLR